MTDLLNEAESVTGKQMCELISEWLQVVHGEDWDPEAIWNYSPTGELSLLFDLYAGAKAWKATQADPTP